MPVTLNNTEEMLDPNIFAVHAQRVTNEWRHKIEIKHLLTEETTREVVDALCNEIVRQLKVVKEREERWQDHADADEREWYLNDIDERIFEFEDLIGDPMDIDDLESEFNYRLSNLYDLGDTNIRLKNGLQKFMWIG